MTRLEKKRWINQKYRKGFRFYAYCNGTVRFFPERKDAELYVESMKYLSKRLDDNFNDHSFYAKEFSDLHCEELMDSRVRIRVD